MAASCTQRMNFYIGFPTLSFQLNMGADCMQQAYQICQESARARALSWQIVMVLILHEYMAASCTQRMIFYIGF